MRRSFVEAFADLMASCRPASPPSGPAPDPPRLMSEQLAAIRRCREATPGRVVPIAHALGLEVYRVSEWPDDLAGMIVKDPDAAPAGYAIFVNGRHSDTRRRRAIARQVAHFVLHRDLIGDGAEDRGTGRSGLGATVERQAARMAGDILAPQPGESVAEPRSARG